MEIAKLWTRSFDTTFLAAWSMGRPSGGPSNVALSRAFHCVDCNGRLCRVELDLFDIRKTNALPRMPKIVVELHREPAFRRSSERLRQPKRHLWSYRTRTL